MARLILFLIIGLISIVITLVKSTVGKVTGNEKLRDTTFRGETEKVMDKTAKGIGWMAQQWEQSKGKEADTSEQPMSDMEKAFYSIAAQEVAQKRVEPAIMAKAFSESAGDEKKTVATYIRYRAAELRQQYRQPRR